MRLFVWNTTLRSSVDEGCEPEYDDLPVVGLLRLENTIVWTK